MIVFFIYTNCCVISDAVTDRHMVKYKDQEVHNLNELEFINGEVWANVYQVSLFISTYKSMSMEHWHMT